jgi:ribosomal protein L6P/L9E
MPVPFQLIISNTTLQLSNTEGFSHKREIDGSGFSISLKNFTGELRLNLTSELLLRQDAGLTVKVPEAGELMCRLR